MKTALLGFIALLGLGVSNWHARQNPFGSVKGSLVTFGGLESEAEPVGETALRHRYFQRADAKGKTPANALVNALKQRDTLRLVQDQSISSPSWTYLGPNNVGGRIRAIVVSPSTNNTIWVASVGGGIWKTTNAGATWSSLNDNFPSMSVGSLILDKNNPQVLYAGTGESYFDTSFAENNKAAIQGAGIYKSTDGGATWFQLSSTTNPSFDCVSRLSMSPTNSQTILASTNSGLFRTLDGGATWSQVYSGKVFDVDFHPTDGNKAVAGLAVSPGVITSSDGGATWQNSTGINSTLRVETAWSRSVTGNIYAGVASGNFVKIWKSTNFGATWTLKSTGTGPGNYDAYNDSIWVDPTNDNNVIVAGVYVYRSTNGGANLTQAFTNVHPDFHVIVEEPGFDGTTKRRVWFGTDGGVSTAANVYVNTTSDLNNTLGITQFYGGAINDSSGRLVAGAQDNSSQVYTGSLNWSSVIGGDGVFCASDPVFPAYFYAGYYYMRMFRSSDSGVNFGTDITAGISERDSEATCNFVPYIALDPNNSNSMLACCKSLWRSNNVRTGNPPTWSPIKPPIASPPGNGDIIRDHFAPESPLNLSFVAVAKSDSNVVWASHNNGQVWKSTNALAGSPSWTRVDTNGPLPARWVSCLTIDPINANHVYVSFLGWEADNIWETTDGGATFHEVTGTTPRHIPSAPVSALSLDPLNAGHLLAGTDIGIFTSWDNGATWSVETQGPGTVPIDFFQWRNSAQLVAYTYGRGAWQGNVTPVDVPILASAYSLFRGNLISGGLPESQVSDDTYLVVGKGFTANNSEAPINIEFTATAPGTIAQSIAVTVESSVSTVNLAQKLQAFNYDTNTWIDIDTRPATTTDQVVTVSLTSGVSSYINSTTKSMKIRWSVKQAGFVPTNNWFARVDAVKWVVRQ